MTTPFKLKGWSGYQSSPMQDGKKGSHEHPHLSKEDQRMLEIHAARIKEEMAIKDPKARNLEAISAAQSYIADISKRLQYADDE